VVGGEATHKFRSPALDDGPPDTIGKNDEGELSMFDDDVSIRSTKSSRKLSGHGDTSR